MPTGKKSLRNRKSRRTQKRNSRRKTPKRKTTRRKTNRRRTNRRRTPVRNTIKKDSLTINVRTSPPRKIYRKNKGTKKEYYIIEEKRRPSSIHYTDYIGFNPYINYDMFKPENPYSPRKEDAGSQTNNMVDTSSQTSSTANTVVQTDGTNVNSATSGNIL